MFQCSQCTKEFRYRSERTRHESSHFPHFECETCCKKFSFISALRRHEKQHERTGSVKCEQCNRKFRDDALLKRHIKYAHNGTYTCEICNSSFSSELALGAHKKTHKPVSERRFKCNYEGCTKSFNFSHHLKHHELTHTGDKQHYCSVCGKGFIQSHHLKTHLKSHDPAEWLFCEAPGCKKKFSTEYSRRRHMATHRNKRDSGISSDSNSCDTSISSKDYTEESFLCATCGGTVIKSQYHFHSVKCHNVEDEDITAEEWPHSPFQPQNDFEGPSTPKSVERGDCSALLGSCIVNDENCICAQMAEPVNNNYDFLPENNNTSVNNSAKQDKSSHVTEIIGNSNTEIVKIELTDHNLSYNENDNACKSCDCATICNGKVSTYCDFSSKVNSKGRAEPNIDYRIDGVIKIKETFDDDIVVNTKDLKNKRFMSFTCKDAIGNCLVNGGDGCLCARMMVEEDQAILAQEIDDITPQPKTEMH